MKTLIAALTLATLIAAPVSIQSATAGTNDGYFGQWKQGCNITYMGFTLCDWYRPDLP
jgi:ATP-dependent protease Clp ATPase subunit